MEELGHQNAFDGGADLQNQLVTRGDSQAEALRNFAEGVAGGEAPNAHRHALPNRDGFSEHGVLLGDGGVQVLADHVEGGLAHAEVEPEFLFGEVRAVAPLPPVLGAVLDPETALLLRGRGGVEVAVFENEEVTASSLGWGGVELDWFGLVLEMVRIHDGIEEVAECGVI